MKRIAVAALKGALWIVGIVVVLGALLAIGNAFDEDLLPEAAAHLKAGAPSKLPDDQNAYFAVAGLGAPDAEQPHAAGRKWADAVSAAVAKRAKGEKAEWPEPVKYRAAPELCLPEKNSCLAAAREKTDAARKLVADNSLLLSRYRAVLAYPGYAETMDYTDVAQPFPAFGPMISAQRALHVDAALRVAQGEVGSALKDLEQEIAFLRRVLAGSNMLITKMVANRLLLRSALLVSDILAQHRDAAVSSAAGLAQSLRPLAAEERQLKAALLHEFRFQKKGFDLMIRHPELAGEEWFMGWARLFYAPNATANMELPFRKAALEADALSAPALAGARKAPPPAGPPAWMAWYNPIGKIFVLPSLRDLSFDLYIQAMHDLDGLVRLVALQAEIVAKGVKDEDVPPFLAGADKGYANPWTEKPMQWDAKARQLHFEPKSKRYLDNRIGGMAGRVGVKL